MLSDNTEKLSRYDNETAEEWMALFQIMAVGCKIKEMDRPLKEKFIMV